MRKINGTKQIEMAVGDYAQANCTATALARFFASRGMIHEFQPDDLDSLGRRKQRYGRQPNLERGI